LLNTLFASVVPWGKRTQAATVKLFCAKAREVFRFRQQLNLAPSLSPVVVLRLGSEFSSQER